MASYILSAFTDEYKTSLEGQLEALQRFDIGYTEVRHVNGKNVAALTENDIKELKKQLDGVGKRVSAIGSPLGKIKLDGDFEAHLETARHIFTYANLLGADFIRVFSFYAPENGDITTMKDEVIDRLGALLTLAKAHGVTLCHENEAKIFGDIPARCHMLLQHFKGELKCVFDMGNFVLEGVEPFAAYEMLRDYIAYFHIKDALAAGAIVPPHHGEARIKEILTAHSRFAKQDFFVSLEPHLQTFSGLNALTSSTFENPYKYEDPQSAFADAVLQFRKGLTV